MTTFNNMDIHPNSEYINTNSEHTILNPLAEHLDVKNDVRRCVLPENVHLGSGTCRVSN